MVALVDRTNATTPIAAARTRFTALLVSSDAARRGALAHRLRQYGARTVVEADNHAGRHFKERSMALTTCASSMGPRAKVRSRR